METGLLLKKKNISKRINSISEQEPWVRYGLSRAGLWREATSLLSSLHDTHCEALLDKSERKTL